MALCDLANLKVLHVSHAVDHFLQLLAEWIERVILLQVGLQRFSIRMRLELMNQLLECFLAGVIMLLDGRMGQYRWILKSISPRQLSLYVSATYFSELARMVEGRSRVGACSVLAFIMQVRLQYNSLRSSNRLICFAVQLFS